LNFVQVECRSERIIDKEKEDKKEKIKIKDILLLVIIIKKNIIKLKFFETLFFYNFYEKNILNISEIFIVKVLKPLSSRIS